jgi:hypothetical protein
MATAAEWAKGFVRQADADFNMYQRLEHDASVERAINSNSFRWHAKNW